MKYGYARLSTDDQSTPGSFGAGLRDSGAVNMHN
jgi:DNA invertase Pin-like site-specific DNA recombinase